MLKNREGSNNRVSRSHSCLGTEGCSNPMLTENRLSCATFITVFKQLCNLEAVKVAMIVFRCTCDGTLNSSRALLTSGCKQIVFMQVGICWFIPPSAFPSSFRGIWELYGEASSLPEYLNRMFGITTYDCRLCQCSFFLCLRVHRKRAGSCSEVESYDCLPVLLDQPREEGLSFSRHILCWDERSLKWR